jgi:hypothetical protein
MWSYLALLLVPVGGAIASRLDGHRRRVAYWLLGAALTVAIGFRYQVGCDWNYYLLVFVRAQNSTSLFEALTIFSPGYMLVNWLAARAGLGVAAVNAVCAAILVSGLLAFSSARPKPWLALLISLPVIILLAGFSATRQATAIGFTLWAFHFYLEGRHRSAIVPILLAAAAFHPSALLMIPLALLMLRGVPARSTAILLVACAAGLSAAFFLLTVPPFSTQLSWYPRSGGAWFRAIPSAAALLAYALLRNRSEVPERERSLLFWLAAFTLFCLPLGLASSTIMDRMGWYAVPFQAAALTRLASLARSAAARLALQVTIATPFVALFLGWLNFGATAPCLIPYRSYLSHPRLLSGDGAALQYKYNGITDPWHLVGARGRDEGGNAAAPRSGR